MSAAVARLAAGDKAPNTWMRYAGALLDGRCTRRFRTFLAESAEGARGYIRTKHRGRAPSPRLASFPSPSGDEMVAGVRAGIRSTRCGGHRGRAHPIFGYEIPAADDLAPLNRRVRTGGSGALPASADRRGRAHAARISAIMSGAALRWDYLLEAELGPSGT